ncbi:MAG: competence protein ComEC [Candidatus Paceibacterota bacterium]|jgi:beta-lactamase superfamily II metal-dependent hydrolase
MKKDIFFPDKGIFRTIFLYVGQGESTLMIIPDGDSHRYLLVDSNYKKDDESIEDIPSIFKEINKSDIIFVNTHPHKDHIAGVKEIKDYIGEVWHSGHMPGKDHEDAFKELNEVIKKVGEPNVFYLRGSNDKNVLHIDKEEKSKTDRKVGDVDFQVLSPAKYICEEIDDETPDQRAKRIHEQCGVIKFIYKDKSILLTGDSDKTAWKEHITDYYKDDLKSDVLSASHHGSFSFFKDKENEDDDVYLDHMDNIKPDYLIISAPKQEDSPHDHPDDEALELYGDYVSKENTYHLGEDEKSIILDIDSEGGINIYKDGEESKSAGSAPEVIYESKGLSKPYFPYDN